MARGKLMILMAGSFVVVWLIAFFGFQRAQTISEIPDLRPRKTLLGPPGEYTQLRKSVDHYRHALRAEPQKAGNYVALASLFLQEARVTGEHHECVAKAQQLVEQALRLDPNNFEALLASASISMTKHRFEEARAIAERALAQNADNASAYGILTDALVELGHYDEAVQACDRALQLRPDLSSYARAAYLREVHGDLDGAIAAMRLACDAGIAGHENRAWALQQLGTLYLKKSKLDTAAFIFNGILQERPQYAYALSGLAKVHTAHGEYQRAIELLQQAYGLVPDHAFLQFLLELHRAVGDHDSAARIGELIVAAIQQHEEDGWQVDLEYAAFCTASESSLDSAVRRAQREYERRPRNLDALSTYAWALYKNDRATEAAPLIEAALRRNPSDARLHFRAGMIAAALAHSEAAAQHLRASLTTHADLSLMEVQAARELLALHAGA